MTSAESAYRATDDDTERRNELVLSQLSQVYYCAQHIRERLPKNVDIEDLVQAGVLGLIEASSKFDEGKHVKFSTFAQFRIRGAILDSLRKLDWGSRDLRRKSRAINASKAKLSSDLGRSPTEEEIASDMKISLSELHDTLNQLNGLLVIGQALESSDENGDPIDLIEGAADRGDDPLALALKNEDRALLSAALEVLSDREKQVIHCYYVEELTMREIAELLGVGTARVSQIHHGALRKARSAIEAAQQRPSRQSAMMPFPMRPMTASASVAGRA
jgi:RNA polymerase sigma factor for flagellar operon FliA